MDSPTSVRVEAWKEMVPRLPGGLAGAGSMGLGGILGHSSLSPLSLLP